MWLLALLACGDPALPMHDGDALFRGDGDPAPGLYTDVVVRHDDRRRTLHVVVPPGDGPFATVLLLHGHFGTIDAMFGLGGEAAPYREWVDLAWDEGLVLLVPQGVDDTDGPGWNDCRADAPTNPETDDVGFLLAAADRVAEVVPTDGPLWVTGTSNGAQMALRLAQEVPERVGAVAPVISHMAADSECPEPDGTVPLFLVPGTDDAAARWDGGEIGAGRGTLLSVPETLDRWVAAAGADPERVVTELPDLDPDDGTTVQHWAHAGPVPVEALVVVGGGHTEPSIAQRYSWLWELLVGRQSHDVEMAHEVWAFFEANGA